MTSDDDVINGGGTRAFAGASSSARLDEPRPEKGRHRRVKSNGVVTPRISPVNRRCPTCGFSGIYRSEALAAKYFGRHSCSKRVASAARRKQTQSSPPSRLDCTHDGRPHAHGTTLAYKKDGCRCVECRAANAAASRTRTRELIYGRWHPFVDADLVRAHVARLRASGLGIERVARLAGTSPSWLGVIVRGTDGQLPARVRADTARRILAVRSDKTNLAGNRKVNGVGTRRRLQALVALGWPPAWIAQQMERDRANLHRVLDAHRVTARTAADVATVYDRLWDKRPQPRTARARRAVADALAMAQLRGWLTPLAWDDIDLDPAPPAQPGADDDEVDDVAVELALLGHTVRLAQLTTHEQDEVVRRLTERGKSLRDIAAQLSTSTRTVSRRRRACAA